MRAFEELTHGRPQATDGSLTVVNIAVEAGVGRASIYRSPVAAAIKEILAAPDSKRPEVDELKAEIRRLRKAERELRKEKAAEIRQLQEGAFLLEGRKNPGQRLAAAASAGPEVAPTS